MNNAAEVYLTKSLKVMVPVAKEQECPVHVVATVAKNLKALGFGLTKPLIERLLHSSEEYVAQWYEETVPLLKKMVGAHRRFRPMYPNFPQQVMEMDEGELYLNAMLHYFTEFIARVVDVEIEAPEIGEKEDRPKLDEKEYGSLRWIDLGDGEDFQNVFTQLVAANGSLSETDKEVLKWFCENRDIRLLLPESIPQKETLAFLVANAEEPSVLTPAVKTATDVLRIACAMSDGDVSLAEPTRFRSFKKAERRFLLESLNTATNPTEDMLRWKNRWIRLGERLHPGEFSKRYPIAAEAFDIIRNKKPYLTFNSKVESGIVAEGDDVVNLLAQRPGDFARRLDHVLRHSSDPYAVVRAFAECVRSVSTPVLLQCWKHFQTRNDITFRSFFPKGNTAKFQIKEGSMPPLREDIVGLVTAGIQDTLIARFSELETLGNVYVSDELRTKIVPFSQRSASRALRTVSRGSSFSLPEGDCVRFFCWWKGAHVDVDLSGSVFDPDWKKLNDLAYYNLKGSFGCHSGDITSAPKGASEFVDISLSSVAEMGGRYIIMSVLSFTGEPFVEMEECFGGWMMRQKPNSGEIYEPQTVQDKVDITSNTRSCVPLIIDAQERRVYWADLSLKSLQQINNASTNTSGFIGLGKAVVEMRKPTLHDLFTMHARGRGKLVSDPTEADTIFDVHEGAATAFDTDKILSEYLI